MAVDILARAAALRAEGTPFVLATVVASYPPQSVRPGAKAIVFADDSIEGWVGGGCIRPMVLQEAREALARGTPRLVRMNSGDERSDADAGICAYPMTCQGEGGVEIYLEPMLPAPRLIVLGETPVAHALARLAGEVGFTVSSRLPDDPSTVAAAVSVVVATMGAGDEEALAAAAASGAAYVGLVASRKKATYLFDFLRASGVSDKQLTRVKAPAGLDLGGMASGEIALSVLAEIVQRSHGICHPERSEGSAGGVRSADPSVALLPQDDNQKGVLAQGDRKPRTLAVRELPADPICGMAVDPATAKHTLVEGDRTVYFCCPRCKARYENAHSAKSGA
jgi:xanthine dehydrogenase accessory factor